MYIGTLIKIETVNAKIQFISNERIEILIIQENKQMKNKGVSTYLQN